MADYDYYKRHFAFRTIPEEYFDGVIERARVVLKKFESIYTVEKYNLAEDLALYSMAEEIYRDDMSRNIEKRSVGSVSIYYVSSVPLEKRLFEIASRHLKIYRGVGQ